jgi:hypothetical protein
VNTIDLLLTDPLYRLFVRVISVQFVALITVLAAVVFIRLRRIRQRRERLAANRSVAPALWSRHTRSPTPEGGPPASPARMSASCNSGSETLSY